MPLFFSGTLAGLRNSRPGAGKAARFAAGCGIGGFSQVVGSTHGLGFEADCRQITVFRRAINKEK